MCFLVVTCEHSSHFVLTHLTLIVSMCVVKVGTQYCYLSFVCQHKFNFLLYIKTCFCQLFLAVCLYNVTDYIFLHCISVFKIVQFKNYTWHSAR